jgi:hypothetical protein
VTATTRGSTLSATGYRVKGVHTVDLSWTGATYVHQICEAGTDTCSNEATVSY